MATRAHKRGTRESSKHMIHEGTHIFTHKHLPAYCILGPSSALPLPFDTVSFNRKLGSRSGERGAFVSGTQRPLSLSWALCVCEEEFVLWGNKCR